MELTPFGKEIFQKFITSSEPYQKTFRKLALQYHPNKTNEPKEHFQDVLKVYEFLTKKKRIILPKTESDWDSKQSENIE